MVSAADVMLVVIGPRRADLLAADDSVAAEIKAALDQGITVIPVLVGDADMPRPDKLPEAIRSLPLRNAVRLSPESLSRERFETACFNFVSAMLYSKTMNPVVLPPGCDRLAIKPAAAGEVARQRMQIKRDDRLCLLGVFAAPNDLRGVLNKIATDEMADQPRPRPRS